MLIRGLKKFTPTADKVFRQQMNTAAPATATSEATLAAGPVVVPTGAERALVLDVSKAVKQLNETGIAGTGNEITFSIDRATRIPVIKVVDIRTKEVLSQWPAEYVLQLAADNIEGKRDSG
jgi:flagellar protein FlaG